MARVKWFDKLLYGSVTPYRGSDIVPYTPAPQPLRTSWVFDSHVVTEASGRGGGRGSTPKSTSLAYAEHDQWGQENIMRSFMGLTPRERKETLLSIFLANPWASNCIDTIALYIISGGMTIEPRVPNPDKAQRKKIEQLLLRINEDWDFNQYVYDLLTDDMIFGEGFSEYTMQGGVPHQLFSIDCVTMDTEHDKWGRVVRYKQQLNLTSEVNYLDKNTIIRWWNPHKRAKVDPFSPMERVQDAILLDKKMVNWSTTFFQKGAKFPYYVKFMGDQDEADRYLTWFKQNNTGEKNAHLPPVAYNGAEFIPLGKGALDIDFDRGLDRMQTIVLSAFHVPPSIACIAESGNRLTDMSDGQRKILQYIACDPRRHRFFEKFNYRLIFPYFGNDYYVSTRYADFRSDTELAQMQDIRVRNGTQTINETRQETGKDAYEKGGDIALFAVSKEVMPVERLDEMAGEQRETAQQTLDAADLNNELLKTKVDQAKNPPPPVIPGQQQGGNTNDVQPQLGKKGTSGKGAQSKNDQPTNNRKGETGKSQAKKATAKEDASNSETLTHNTGMMLAFMLDEKTAKQLALPGGEKPEDMHITLAYIKEVPADIDQLKKVVTSFASEAIPLEGSTQGLGRFAPSDHSDGKSPIIALLNVTGLQKWRAALVKCVESLGIKVANDFDFTPHITLAYIDADAPTPIEHVPEVPLAFDTLWLCIGDERIPFTVGDEQYPDYWEKKAAKQEDYNPLTHVWEPDDADQQLAMLKEQGYTHVTWIADNYACDVCIMNDGVTIRLGEETFPGGQQLVAGHPNCQCEPRYSKEDEVKP